MDKKELLTRKDRFKALVMGSVVVFLFATLSLIISLGTTSNETLQKEELGYIIVIAISIIVFTIFAILYYKTAQKIKNIQE